MDSAFTRQAWTLTNTERLYLVLTSIRLKTKIMMYEILHYLTSDEKNVYLNWLHKLRDMPAKIAINRRVNRIELGNFGDHKFCRDGVWELRIDVGAGYRMYYAIAGKEVVLLLCGGDKQTQAADIERACEYWKDWQRRKDDEER